MQVVIREYSGKGAKELFDVLEKNKADVESLLRTVKGLVSYTLARSGDGGFSVTVCQGSSRHRREHSEGERLGGKECRARGCQCSAGVERHCHHTPSIVSG